MVKIYYDLIQSGLRKIEDVPILWREGVEKLLEKNEEV